MEAKSKKKASGNEYHFMKGQYEQRGVPISYSRQNHRRGNISKDEHPGSSKFDSPYFTKEELDLCKHLKLSGTNYMLIKESLIRESLRLGHIEREPTMHMFAVEKFVINNIINFLADR